MARSRRAPLSPSQKQAGIESYVEATRVRSAEVLLTCGICVGFSLESYHGSCQKSNLGLSLSLEDGDWLDALLEHAHENTLSLPRLKCSRRFAVRGTVSMQQHRRQAIRQASTSMNSRICCSILKSSKDLVCDGHRKHLHRAFKIYFYMPPLRDQGPQKCRRDRLQCRSCTNLRSALPGGAGAQCPAGRCL